MFFSNSDGYLKKTTICSKCGLYRQCESPKMKGVGKGNKKVLFVGESPDITDDEKGMQFMGSSGRKLRSVIPSFDECRAINTVNCKTDTVTQLHIDCCTALLSDEIDTFKPKVIIPLGTTALNAIMSRFYTGSPGGISLWRGLTVYSHELHAWIAPTIDPDYVCQMDYDPVVELLFKQDIENAFDLINKKPPEQVKDAITILDSDKMIKSYLNFLIKSPPEYLAFDYETTGLKPYNKGHSIRSIGFAHKPEMGYAFIYDPKYRDLVVKVLQNDSKKIAHNMKYEDTWSNVIIGTKVNNWFMDTMLMSHIIDNRRGITGLKFQAFMRFGIPDYSSHLKSKLMASDSNSINHVYDIPEKDLLTYNALDAVLEYRCAMEQINEMGL